MNKLIKYLLDPVLKAEYKRGFDAGVNAEMLVKAQDDTRREYDILQRGKALGREELLREMESPIEEISAEEFDEIAQMAEGPRKPFGFVGTMEKMQLVLESD